MTQAATIDALDLLARGYQLYAGAAPDPMPIVTPSPRHLSHAAPDTAAHDAMLASVLAAARSDHALARHATRALLDDALADRTPAADTASAQREALRRMVSRLRSQHVHIQHSHQQAGAHTRRLRSLGYLHYRHAAHPSRSPAIPLDAVRYDNRYPVGSVTRCIAQALDHLGITEPSARRNWLRGYHTLIARESGGRPGAVASEPAMAPGPSQPDGHGLGYARGITQTIPATFACYHQPGTSTNIFDPVANICASMNYVIRRYGVAMTGENLATLVQQADARRTPKGY